VAEDGGELVASHARQRVIGPEALRKDARDGLDQSLRGSRTVLPDHIAVPVHVDGQKREALGIFPARSSSVSNRRRFHSPVSASRSPGSNAAAPGDGCAGTPAAGPIDPAAPARGSSAAER
jgi:hypothetical protein